LITLRLQLDLVRLLLSLSDWLDWSQHGITNHHKQVAFASLSLGKEIGLDNDSLSKLFKAASIHDIGAVTWSEKLSLTRFDLEHTRPHCKRGQYFVSKSNLLSHLGTTILHHHDTWSGSNPEGVRGGDIPLLARIIHLCDRVAILISHDDHVLNQRRNIVSRIRDLSGAAFDPELVEAFESLAQRDSFWLDLAQPSLGFQLNFLAPVKPITSTATELGDLAKVMAYAVDAKSRFTYRHSHGVAAVARFLAELCGFDPEKRTLLEIAGLLHDLGKLTVPEAILEKPGALTPAEISWIRQHTYYTYWFLLPAGIDQEMTEWAAFHHERLDGRGYPFGVGADRLELEHRIVAVADIFTALREDRPYRRPMQWEHIARILTSQAKSGGIDGDVVNALLSEADALEELWSQLSAKLAPMLTAEV